jgi:iron complex outermembrane receptor protein
VDQGAKKDQRIKKGHPRIDPIRSGFFFGLTATNSSRRFGMKVFGIVLGVLLIISPFTQAAEEKKATDEKSRDTVYLMDTVFVSATKTEEKRKDIPNALVYKDKWDLQESPAKTLGEFLSSELGLDWRTRGNFGGAAEEIHIRGMSGNATQILVNGVSVNSPSLGSADVGRIPMNNIEKVEIIKGSGSLLYGSGAMGGTINIITKRPQKDKIDLAVSAGYGSQDTIDASFEHGMFIIGDLGYYLTASHRQTNGFRDNSDLSHFDTSINIVLDKGDLLDVSLYGDYIDRKYGVPGVRPSSQTSAFYFKDDAIYNHHAASLDDMGSDEDGHIVLQIKSHPLDWLGVTLRGEYSHMENYNYARWYNNFVFPPIYDGQKSWTTNGVMGFEGNLEIKPFEGATLLAGVEHNEYTWKNRSYSLENDGDKIGRTEARIDEDFDTTGYFAEAQYRPCRYIKFLAGMRHEEHSVFGNIDLPRYGVVVNPFESTAIKFSHGKHFRAPTPNDLFWPVGPWVAGNPDLVPEKGWHTDITIEQSFLSDKIFLTVSYFHWKIENRILWDMNGQGVWQPQNLHYYEADGFEAGARIGPFWNLTLGLNYTYTDAQEEAREFYYQSWWPTTDLRFHWNKRRATYTPKNQFKGSLIYRSKFGLTAQIIGKYVGNRYWYRDEVIAPPFGITYETVRYELDAYWTMDLKIEQRFCDHWTVSLEGNNIFDTGYTTYFGTFSDYNKSGFFGPPLTTLEGFPGAGRSVMFKVKWEY